VAFRKLSRTSSHRMLMLRNLVSSLLEHEQIKTTLPKAKEAARMAEKIITLGKRGDLPAQRKAASFLLNGNKTLPLLFGQYAERYILRPGGYTRIHKFGHRKGDHAPHAILELCDNPRDIKFEIIARSVGRETVQRWLKTGGKTRADQSEEFGSILDKPWIRETTKINYQQLIKYATPQRKVEFENRAIDWANHLLAEAHANGGLRLPAPADKLAKPPGPSTKHLGRRQLAGERLAGIPERASSLAIASGSIGRGSQTARQALKSSAQERGVCESLSRPGPWRSPFWEGGWSGTVTQKQAIGVVSRF